MTDGVLFFYSLRHQKVCPFRPEEVTGDSPKSQILRLWVLRKVLILSGGK